MMIIMPTGNGSASHLNRRFSAAVQAMLGMLFQPWGVQRETPAARVVLSLRNRGSSLQQRHDVPRFWIIHCGRSKPARGLMPIRASGIRTSTSDLT